jgi:hypothetical protein
LQRHVGITKRGCLSLSTQREQAAFFAAKNGKDAGADVGKIWQFLPTSFLEK